MSALISGIFFVFCGYTAKIGFRGLPDPLDKSTAPFNDLANNAHLPFLGVLISVGAVVSMWACTLASVNAASRVIFTMGRHGVIHGKLGLAHGKNETPHHAVTVCALITFAFSALFGWLGLGVQNMERWPRIWPNRLPTEQGVARTCIIMCCQSPWIRRPSPPRARGTRLVSAYDQCGPFRSRIASCLDRGFSGWWSFLWAPYFWNSGV